MPLYVIPPAGTSAASLFTGTPIVDPARPPAILAFARSTKTGAIESLFVGEHPIDAMVKRQCRTRRGTGAAALDVGNLFHEIVKHDDSAADQARAEALRIMKPLIDAGFVDSVGVQIESNQDKDFLGAFLVYRNTQTAERGREKIL